MGSRRRFKQSSPLGERLAEEAKSLRELAKTLPPGPSEKLYYEKRDKTKSART